MKKKTEAVEAAETSTTAGGQPRLDIQRIYVKDLSLELPASPAVFLEEWKPEVNVNIEVKNALLSPQVFEVVLTVTVKGERDKKALFLIEVHEAGIFHIEGFDAEQQDRILGAVCPNILFPYVREVVADLSNRGTIPVLNLTPVNFDAWYLQQKTAANETETKQ